MLAEAYKFKPCPEVNVLRKSVGEGYETFVTTDDHHDASYRYYQRQKQDQILYHQNSWGTNRNTFGVYLNMSESHVRAKTIFLMVHKKMLFRLQIKQKLGIK